MKRKTETPTPAVSRTPLFRSVKKKRPNSSRIKYDNLSNDCEHGINRSLRPRIQGIVKKPERYISSEHIRNETSRKKKGKLRRSRGQVPEKEDHGSGASKPARKKNAQKNNEMLSSSFVCISPFPSLSSSDESDNKYQLQSRRKSKILTEENISHLRTHINNTIESDEDSDDADLQKNYPSRKNTRRQKYSSGSSQQSQPVFGQRQKITTYDNILRMFSNVRKGNQVDAAALPEKSNETLKQRDNIEVIDLNSDSDTSVIPASPICDSRACSPQQVINLPQSQHSKGI